MSYVLLGSLFLVSGISGSKVSDMATVAPALFPEMKKRGAQAGGDGRAAGATGAPMADTVPPSLVLIMLGSVTGVSIAALFQSGFVVGPGALARAAWCWPLEGRHEDMRRVKRAPWEEVGRLAAGRRARRWSCPSSFAPRWAKAWPRRPRCRPSPSLTPCSIGLVVYGDFEPGRSTAMLVETAALSGADPADPRHRLGDGMGHDAIGVVQQLSQTSWRRCPAACSPSWRCPIVVFVRAGLRAGRPARRRAVRPAHVPDRQDNWASTKCTTRWSSSARWTRPDRCRPWALASTSPAPSAVPIPTRSFVRSGPTWWPC